jgi:2,5-dioxopentanoate dehydrogenase
VIAVDGHGLDTFIAAARDALAQSSATPMLTPGIADAFATGVTRLTGQADLIGRGEADDSQTTCRAALFATDVNSFLNSETLQAEIFGSSSLIVRCADAAEMQTVAENIEGQLTATVHADESDHDDAGELCSETSCRNGNGRPTTSSKM